MRENVMKPGNLIILNGTSSAGKTTIAKELQRIMDEPYLHMGNDQFFAHHRPDSLLTISDGSEHSAVDGWLAVFQNDRFVSLTVGPVALRWLAGMYRAMAAWSESGNHLVGDVVLHNAAILRAAAAVFHPLPAWLISVYCPLEVAEERERERTERRAEGGARVFFEGVYRHGIADLLVDSATCSPQACAEQIKQHVSGGHSPRAFQQLHHQMIDLS
jgi:chloramphenicol 3-O phosphotransferase